MRIDISRFEFSTIATDPRNATRRAAGRTTSASSRRASTWLTVAVIGTLGLFAAGCTPSEQQRVIATGELLEPDGVTPLADTLIDSYELTLSFVSDGGGEVDIRRDLIRDGDRAIVTDADGQFQIVATIAELSYQWDRDEYVCEDVCVTWDTVCNDVSEEVCDVCSEDECWDDCSEECSEECWDETVCDEDGDCWTETVCTEECYDVCQTVCEPVKYDCNCRWETYEECDDQCTETTAECDWLTRTYTSYPTFSEVTNSRATVRTRDEDGNRKIIVGESDAERTGPGCDRNGTCDGILWLQQDRFVMPAPAP